jgi:RHS repeat-associated protein
MKTKSWLLLAALALLTPLHVGATGACTAARFHDWQDFGCNQNYSGAGGVPKAKCPSCPGMPQWWVHEPYENLWMSDTPLSYTTSSGQEIPFTFYYRQRYKMPDADEAPSGRNDPFVTAREQVSNYYDLTGMTNASWGNNWMMAITFWDQSWETNWTDTGRGFYSAPLTPVFSDGYEALFFQSDGGMNYFTSSSLQDPQSQMRLQPVSSVPMITNNPSSDANGIYWGDAGMGFKIVYPDGSQDVFGLTFGSIPTESPAGGYGTSTTSAFLTQRIDPQGRVTSVGYERASFTNFWSCASSATYYGFRIKYVVDPDGRTNTFVYNNNSPTNSYSLSHCCIEDSSSLVLSNLPARTIWQISEIDDPYGRKVKFGYDYINGILTSITDAAGLTSSFQYNAPAVTNSVLLPDPTDLCDAGGVCRSYITGLGTTSGWITNLTTPYGSTSFSYYQLTDPTATEPDAYIQRAVYVSEPTGANQFYLYLHNSNGLLPTTATSPSVPGVTDFDNGTSGSTHPTLDYRNTIHWDRRQFSVLSGTVKSDLSSGSLSNAIAALTSYDFNKGRIRNWLWQPDAISISESVSSEQDPSPDAGGTIPGLRTWYDYPGKPSPELLGSNPQVSCIARLLPDGTSQYTTFNYYLGIGLVSDSESSYSKPDGTVGALTNRFVYAANGIDLASVSNSAGQSLNFGYNGSHQIAYITNALNQVSTLSWDTYTFNLTGVQLPGGQSVGLSYGSSDYGRLQTISWSPSGRSFTINSYSNGLPASVTDDRGLTVSQTWDGLNRLTGEGFPDGTLISNIYTRLDLTATKDRLGNWTSYSFDGLRHLTTVTNANSAVTSYSWCGCGSLDQIIDATLTNYTTFNYDNQGNLTNIEFPDYSSLTYQFDLDGRMTNAFDGANRSVHLSYNNQGLPTNISGAYGTLQSAAYDSVNRPTSITDANGVTITNTYDALNELLTRKWADGIGEGFGYSAAGMIAYTNRDGRATHYGLDTAGRISAVTNANLEVIQVAYDSLDNVTSLIDGLNHTNNWQYNQYGWLTNKVDGLGRNAFRFSYNPNGWVTNRWTPQNGNAGYGYDNVGNLTSIAYPSSSITYAYNVLNQLTSMVDAVGTTTFSYTPAGQLASEKSPWTNNTVSYTYVQGLRTALSLSQPSGSWSQTYGFDSSWRMTNIVSPAGAFGYSYNVQPESSLISEISLPNEAYITNSFDSLARLKQTSLNNYYKWGHTLDGYSYGFDALGLATNITRNLGLTSSSVSVGFDNIGQITSWMAKETNGTPRLDEQLGFGFDTADNLHTRTNGLLSQAFNADAANELTNVTRGGTFTLSGATPAPVTNITVNGNAAQTYGDFTFASTNNSLVNGSNTFTIIAQNMYGVAVTNSLTLNLPTNVSLASDANGNLTNDGMRTFGYDSENQLTNVAVAGQWRSSFVYDGLNRRRIARDYTWSSGAWVQTNEVHYIYDGYLPIQERDSNNVPQVTYTRGLDLSGDLWDAGGIGGLLARTDTNSSTFYHGDGAGNITALMDGNENIVGRYLYNPFGKLIGQWGSMANANTMQFSSMPQRRGITLYPLRGYEPNFQRFLNQDPIQELGGINLYRFVGNNPINGIDPFGLWNLWDPATWGVPTGAGTSMWNSLNPFDGSAGWSGFSLETSSEADAAFLDGVIPGQLFSSLYDPCDKLLQWSKDVGGLTRDTELTLAGGGLASSLAAREAELAIQRAINKTLIDTLELAEKGKWDKLTADLYNLSQKPGGNQILQGITKALDKMVMSGEVNSGKMTTLTALQRLAGMLSK